MKCLTKQKKTLLRRRECEFLVKCAERLFGETGWFATFKMFTRLARKKLGLKLTQKSIVKYVRRESAQKTFTVTWQMSTKCEEERCAS